MDDDVDIYGDLPSFDINECTKCQQQTNEFTQKYAKLEEEILSWKGKFENLEQEKKIILTNTSSLLKTARAEINRKDRTILDLRRELEDVKFRRGVWSKSKTPYHRHNYEPRETKPCVETTYYKKELPPETVEAPSLDDGVAICDEEEQDPEQKWDPTCQKSTVYGERLRKKLLQEQEAERIRKEEAKNAEPKNSGPCPSRAEKLADQKDQAENTLVDVGMAQPQPPAEESRAPPSGGTQLTKAEELGAIESSVKSENLKEEQYEDLSEEGELSDSSDDKDNNDDRYWEEDGRKDEFVHRGRDDDHRDDSNNRNSHLNHDFRYNPAYKSRHRSRNDPRASGYSERKHGEPDAHRQTHDLRSKLNYRSHARAERPRDRSDKNEKPREDRLTRDKYDPTDQSVKDNHDPRERLERKYEDRFFYESRNDHDRNYDSDHKRLGKSRSPGETSRSKSSSSRSSQSGRHRSDRSKSRGRFAAEKKSGTEKNRSDHKQRSKDCNIANEDRANNESSSRNPVEKAKNKIPDEFKFTNSRESREKSTRASSRRGDRRPIEKSESREPLDAKFKGESKIKIHEKKGGSGDHEITTGQRDKDLPIEPISESSKKNCPSVENTKNEKKENLREKTIDCAEKGPASSEKKENSIDTQDKFILMLENDSEIALSPIARRETESTGSRSFREEKIENIEKFILDYKDDAIHCSLLGNDVDSSELKGENNFANSTSSIVDTLSMDVDDLENELAVKSEGKALKTNVQVDSIPQKDQNLTMVSKIEKNHATEKSLSQVSPNEERKQTAIDEEPKRVIAPEKSVGKTLEPGVAVEKKVVELVKEKNKEIFTKKSQGRDKKCESSASIDKKMEKSKNNNKTQHAGSDGKPIDKKKEIDEKSSRKVHKKVQKVDGDEKLKVTESIEPITENKESTEKADDLGMSKKIETTKIIEKTDDHPSERKCQVSLDEESKNVNQVGICDNKNDEKVENVADSKSNDRAVDKDSRTVELDEKSETVQVRASDEAISKSLPPPLPPSPDLPAAPPLPPSPEVASLPPLPPSPPPEEKEPEISSVLKVSTIKAEAKKPQTEKIVSKQTKNRPRIPCLSIVSLYSRKRRGMVLTDSTSSRTVVTSLKSTEGLEVVKESLGSQKTPKIGSNPLVTPMEPEDTETPSKKIESSENPSTGSKIPEAEEKAAETEPVEGRERPEPKEDDKIISQTKNCLPEHHKPEVDTSEPVATPDIEEIKPKDHSAGGSSQTEKNSVEKVQKIVDEKVEEIRAEVETTEKCDRISASCTSSKSSERAKRSVLKSIASTTDSTECASSNRKRPLSKEKENQSKPPKQAKIMIIARRRPVQLQDSSTATTLVPSVHDDSSKNNKTQSSQKNVTASGRKRRVAES